ncbi:MAG: hypothetical protein R3B45_01755 [Bdellovibrionota bacterium]
MEHDERLNAEKELVSFVQEYCSLINAHLKAVRHTMAETTEAIMDGVSAINEKKDDKKKMAEAILLKRTSDDAKTDKFQGDDQDFRNSQSNKDEDLGHASGSAQKLAAHIKSFDQFDDQLQEILFGIIGALSTDDVVGQRIEHICQALDSLKEGLTKILNPDPGLISLNDVVNMETNLVRNLKASYTMPLEHEVHDDIFSQSNVNKASKAS